MMTSSGQSAKDPNILGGWAEGFPDGIQAYWGLVGGMWMQPCGPKLPTTNGTGK